MKFNHARFPIQIVTLTLGFVLAIACTARIGGTIPGVTSAAQHEAESVLWYLSPEQVDLAELQRTELLSESQMVIKFLQTADSLARSNIGYRKDSRKSPLTRREIHDHNDNLSCTEFVWLVYSLSGLDLGNFHIETKEMAYDRGVYAPQLSKHKPGVEILPGDTLVYEYTDEQLIREEEDKGHYSSGHAVMVVSARRKIIVGSHGAESSPTGAPTGVGYRQLLTDWDLWTAGRKLKAIYRLSTATQTAPANQVGLPSHALSVPLRAISHGLRDRPQISLTFDACSTRAPGHYDERITQVLVETKTPATIFSYSHPHLIKIPDAQVFAEIERTQKILLEQTGWRADLFRPPYGEYDDRVVRLAAKLGLTTVEYDLASGDPDKHFTKEILITYLLKATRNGSIIVMHINGRGWHTSEALPDIISGLRGKEFEFVTVGELVRNLNLEGQKITK